MQVLGFDERDLAMNRRGRISANQVARLTKARQSYAPSGNLIFALGAVLVLVLALVIGAARLSNQVIDTLTLTFLVFVVLAFSAWQRFDRIAADIRTEEAAEVEGRIELSMHTTWHADSYFVRVGSMRFKVTQQEFLVFKNGDPYRIFYAANSKRILSAEWLREDDNPFNADEDFDDAASSADGQTYQHDSKASASS